jgi:hypothetical protein
MASGTIIHAKSRMTDGAAKMRPAIVVCCVAIALTPVKDFATDAARGRARLHLNRISISRRSPRE